MNAVQRELALKEKVRERCGWKCHVCNLSQEDQKARGGRALSVHRLVSDSEYEMDGCVALCNACHCRAHAAAKQKRGVIPPASFAIVHPRLSTSDYVRLRACSVRLGLTLDETAVVILQAGLVELEKRYPPAERPRTKAP
jgi:hypothetical protein